MERLHVIQTDSSKAIRGLASDPETNICFAVCNADGLLHVYNLGSPGQEHHATKHLTTKTKENARAVLFSKKRGEIYVGNSNGTIFIFLSTDLSAPICKFPQLFF
jgi:hypothetical protein